MMLIFDLKRVQPSGSTKFHGGGKYGEVIFRELVKSKSDIVAYYDYEKWLNPEIDALITEKSIERVDSRTISLIDCAKKYNGCIYSPIVDERNSEIGSVKFLTTVHGLRVLEIPYDLNQYYYRSIIRNKFLNNILLKLKAKIQFERSLKRYSNIFNNNRLQIVTVSEHSKSSILNFFPKLKANNLKVFYSPSTVDRREVKSYSNSKYYLLVSGNRWIKNSYRAIEAFDELFSERLDFHGEVIITGISDKELDISRVKNKDRFKFLNYVDEVSLLRLFKGAFGFVYPSLNEGFGYPPLQAMYYQVPIIASAISSIPEVCGNAALYFNPLLISEIKMRILQLEDNSIRSELITNGKSNLSRVEQRQESDLNDLVKYIISFSETD